LIVVKVDIEENSVDIGRILAMS